MTLHAFIRTHYREIIGQPIADAVRMAREHGVRSSSDQIVKQFNLETRERQDALRRRDQRR